MRDLFLIYLQNSIAFSFAALLATAVSPLLARRYSAKCRYCLWLVIFAGMLLPVRLSVNIELPEFLSLHQNTGIAVAGQSNIIGALEEASDILGGGQWLGLLWAGGGLCFLGWHIIGHVRFMSTIKRWSGKVEKDMITTIFERTKRDLNIGSQIELRHCTCVKTPMIVGFTRPAVLLPELDIPDDELVPILKHELVHFKRKDQFAKLLMLLSLSVHWFNPIAHFMLRQACGLCEISCDEEALRGMDEKSRAKYGEAIIGIARSGMGFKTSLSANFFIGVKGMRERVYAIMDMTKKRFSPALPVAAFMIAVCCITAFSIVPAAAVESEFDTKTQIAVPSSKPDTDMSIGTSTATMTPDKYAQEELVVADLYAAENDNKEKEMPTTVTDNETWVASPPDEPRLMFVKTTSNKPLPDAKPADDDAQVFPDPDIRLVLADIE
jgi:beta-lactamase regulating signal transducer with metallopeptidase domain